MNSCAGNFSVNYWAELGAAAGFAKIMCVGAFYQAGPGLGRSLAIRQAAPERRVREQLPGKSSGSLESCRFVKGR
jgi:hypothetical protein